MSDINNISSSLDALSIASKQPEVKRTTELGQDAFLELLITQLNNQDPLNPQDSSEFVAQLAQFSSLEGIQKLNTGVQDMATSFRSSQALQASALVGRSVLVPASSTRTDANGGIEGLYGLEASTNNVTINIKDSSGALVQQLELGPQAAGDNAFAWDGIKSNGDRAAPGTYSIEALAIQDGELVEVPVYLGANVNSVTLGTDSDMTLNVEGAGSIPLSSVKQIL